MTRILVRIIVNTHLWILFEFKPRDCWIGVYWTNWSMGIQDTWICILPMFPIHIVRFNYE